MTPKQSEMTIKEPIDILIVEDSKTQAGNLENPSAQRGIREEFYQMQMSLAEKANNFKEKRQRGIQPVLGREEGRAIFRAKRDRE
jgi:hypothetical protein